MIITILSANREATKLIVHSFEFWLKVSCSVVLAALISIYWYHRDGIDWIGTEDDDIGKDNGNGNGIRTLELIGSILFGICYIGIVVVIGLFDGVQNSKLWKVSISGIVGLVAMFATINYEFIMVEDSDYEVDIPLIDGTFSF